MRDEYKQWLAEIGFGFREGCLGAFGMFFLLVRAPFVLTYALVVRRDLTFRFSIGPNVIDYGLTERQRQDGMTESDLFPERGAETRGDDAGPKGRSGS